MPADLDASLAFLAPELILAGMAGFILLADAFWRTGLSRNAILALALLGIIASALFTLPLLSVDRLTFSGAMAIDAYAGYFKLLFLTATALVLLAAVDLLDERARYRAEFVSLLLLSTVALMILAAATDLITAYVALEMSSLSIVFLSAWNKRDLRSTEAGLKFFLLSAMASAILLYGMALLYGLTGELTFEGIARHSAAGPGPALFLALAMLLAGFGFKISAVPFQMWTPDVYEGAPTPVTAYLSVASKAAGFAVAIRVFAVALPEARADWTLLVALLAVATMSVGNVAALVQSNLKRLLAYSSIAQAGYILVGIAAASQAGPMTDRAVAAVLYYLLAYTATNLTAFIAVIGAARGVGSEDIAAFRGLAQRAPGLSFALAVGLLSLAGLPPFVGFFAKLYVFWAAAESGLWWLVLAAVINSAISLYYYAQVIHDMYLLAPAETAPQPRSGWAPGGRLAAPSISLGLAVAGVMLLGVFSGLVFSFQEMAAVTLTR